MNVVTFRCRECNCEPSFASDYPSSDIDDMQQHMDISFKARCGGCYSCDWEVIDVKKVVGALDVSNRTASRKLTVQ